MGNGRGDFGSRVLLGRLLRRLAHGPVQIIWAEAEIVCVLQPRCQAGTGSLIQEILPLQDE
jgi:hypothetical protein